MNIKIVVNFLLLAFVSINAKAELSDTIRVNSTDINTKVLREGTHRYLVYFKMKKDSVRTQTQFWTRELRRNVYQGKNVIEINQSWEDKDSIIHIVKSIADAKTMQPLYHYTWWKVQRANNPNKVITSTSVDFMNKVIEVDGKQVVESDTAKRFKAIWKAFTSIENQFCLNWHSDLETFPVLSYRNGVVFEIPFYEPGSNVNLSKVHYKVSGSAVLKGYDDQSIDCWLLVHESAGNKEIFWISKKTKEVLKLEQEINGTIYRYKIKLGFSN